MFCSVPKEESYELSEDTVEMDEINSHECMAKMSALLKHLQQNKISPELPKVWNVPYIIDEEDLVCLEVYCIGELNYAQHKLYKRAIVIVYLV